MDQLRPPAISRQKRSGGQRGWDIDSDPARPVEQTDRQLGQLGNETHLSREGEGKCAVEWADVVEGMVGADCGHRLWRSCFAQLLGSRRRARR